MTDVQKPLYWLSMEKKYYMPDKIKINLKTVQSIIANAGQYDDDPEELVILLATSTVVLAGLADVELDNILKYMNFIYPAAVKAGATLQGYPTTTQ